MTLALRSRAAVGLSLAVHCAFKIEEIAVVFALSVSLCSGVCYSRLGVYSPTGAMQLANKLLADPVLIELGLAFLVLVVGRLAFLVLVVGRLVLRFRKRWKLARLCLVEHCLDLPSGKRLLRLLLAFQLGSKSPLPPVEFVIGRG